MSDFNLFVEQEPSVGDENTERDQTLGGGHDPAAVTPPIRIIIEPTALGDRGQRYRVTYAGETLIESTRNPEYDACRALLAKGVTGRLEVWRVGTTFPASSIDIERGARWTILETERESPRIVRWRSFGAGES